MPYILHNTALGTTKALPRVQTYPYERKYAITLERAPDSEVWTPLGDAKPEPATVRLEFVLASASEAANRAEWNAIIAFAQSASSLSRDAVSFRALQPLGYGLVYENFVHLGQLKQGKGVLEFAPLYAFATTTKAESIAAYTAAIKTRL